MTNWDIGTLWKPGIWFYYVLSNWIGSYFCILLAVSILCDKKRTPSDVMLGSVALACLIMSMTCGIQCFLNMIHHSFFGEEVACQTEAILHVSTIMIEFCSVAMMTFIFCDHAQYNLQPIIQQYSSSDSIINVGRESQGLRQESSQAQIHFIREPVSHRVACIFIVAIWVLCTILVIALSFVSHIYLISAGTYCFFSFSSPAIIVLCVILVTSICIMVFYHIKVVKQYQLIVRISQGTTAFMHSIFTQQFKWRSTIHILLLVFGWGSAVIALLYEWIYQVPSPEWIVTQVGVGGVSYTWAVPLCTALFNEPNRENQYRSFLISFHSYLLQKLLALFARCSKRDVVPCGNEV
jgi:hypothetical protein